MPFIPSLPSWSGIHIALVHLPIGMLLLSPVFVILAMFPGRWRESFRIAALIILLLGSIAAIFATQSGEAAAKLVDVEQSQEIESTLEEHEEFAEVTTGLFIGITVFYAIFLSASRLFPVVRRRAISITAQILALIAILIACLLLADTGHLGGQLVHRLGVRATL